MSSSSRFLLLLLGLALAAGPLAGADRPADDTRLVVTQGNIVGVSVDAKPARATLRNLADELMRRYPDVTINLAGVDETPVAELTLRAPKAGRDHAPETVLAILSAVAETGQPGTFVVTRFGENQFLLSRPRATGAARHNIEVFNLKAYLEGRIDKADLEMQVRQTEMRLRNLTAHHERVSSEVARGTRAPNEESELKNEIAFAREQLALAMQKLRRAAPSKEETNKRLDQLIQVVSNTLNTFDAKEKAPEFEYHAGTYLLVVIGSDAAIDVTRKVVTALEKSSD